MNCETPFARYSITILGIAMLGFFAFITVARPFAQGTRPLAAHRETAALNTVTPPVSVPEPDHIDAEAYLVRLVGQPIPLLARHELKRLPPASLTKLMTAMIAKEELNPSDLITFSQAAKRVDPTQSSAAIGESFFRDDALKLAVIESANDAAQALAESVGKKYHAYDATTTATVFSDLMNKKAQTLGMVNSHFQNPIGFDDAHHFMSAADVGRLLEYIWNAYPSIFEISRAVQTTVYSADRRGHAIENTNDLLKEFPAILGSKTGFTDAAQGTLAMLYPVKPGRVALIVILRSRDRFGDGKKLIRWLENSFQ